MFDHPTKPEHLLTSLVGFVDLWHGVRDWYGIAAEKLGSVSLPRPLAHLYGALGNMPGTEHHPFPFSEQDRLLPFELLQLENGRLLFAVENQGCWRAYTEPSGDDPPVWFLAGEEEPELEHPSLANFLVTLCLQELTMGCPILYAGQDLTSRLEAQGHRVSPLWLDGLFPGFDQLLHPKFHLADGRALISDGHWIGFRSSEQAGVYSVALEGTNRIHPTETLPIAEYLSRADRNPTAVRIYYERKAREFQAQADAFQAKAAECLRLARGSEPPDGPERPVAEVPDNG